MAIHHSGDVVDASRSEGRHTIDINLHNLSNKIGTLYFTLSSWGGAKLADIVRPEIRFFDPEEKSLEPLIRYELDGKPTGDWTAVIMACVSRTKPEGVGR